ncbi:hypothetical protein ABPG74_010229 [Tetrahymena malaccensis]
MNYNKQELDQNVVSKPTCQNDDIKAEQIQLIQVDCDMNELDIKEYQEMNLIKPRFIEVNQNYIDGNKNQLNEEIQMENADTHNQNSALSFDNNIYQIQQKASIIQEIILITQKISKVYSISSGNAFFLLRSNCYDFQICFQFDQSQLDKKLIIQQSQPLTSQTNDSCLLCECLLNIQNRYSLECEHYFCRICYNEYMKSLLNLGALMLQKTCPMDGCQAKIGLKEVFELIREPQQLQQAQNILFNDYLQINKKAKVCPLQNCQNVFIFSQKLYQQINLRCDCESQYSCSSCQEEAHLPLNCEQYQKWMSLISTVDSKVIENVKYIMQNTKACPNCKVAVEKNGGCQHMKCQNCQSHFCWACLQITTNFSHPNFCKNEITKQHESLEVTQLIKKEKYQQQFLYYKQLATLSQSDYVANYNFFYNFISLFDKDIQDIQIKFRKYALNILYEAKFVLAYSYPVAFFLQDQEKLSFLEYLQKNLESYLNKFEYHLTQEFRELFNEQVFEKESLNQISNQLNLFYIYSEETQQFIQQLKNSLRNLVNQIQFDYPNQEIFYQNKYDLLHQDQIENEIKIKKKQIKQFQNQDSGIIKCSDCNLHLAENDFGLCNYCFEYLYTQQQ